MNVSAIIAVFNGADRLGEAIDSIRAQDLAPFEIIVVDDGSTDATPDVIRSFGGAIRPLRQDNAGLSAAHNLALRHAGGDAIAFLDHDDLWPPLRLSTMARTLDRDDAIDVVAGLVEMRYERPGTLSDAMRRTLETTHRPWMVHSLLIRRSVFDRIGTFDLTFKQGMDVDWYMRARDRGIRFELVPEPSLIYRLHQNNMTRDVSGVFRGLLGAFKNSLDRRRTPP